MSLAPKNWQNLPHHVFGNIITMAMTGRDIHQNLQKCRQVSYSWNIMITQMTKHEKKYIRNKTLTLGWQIRKNWRNWLLPEITTAASLAYQRMMCSQVQMVLRDVDLASIPSEHLASLASRVTTHVSIINVSNCDLTSILDSVKCEWLIISSQTLSTEETRALVQAMESRVERVELGEWGERGEMSLDIMALTQYSGQGKCEWVRCYYDTARKYMEELRTWAVKINWVTQETLEMTFYDFLSPSNI